MNVGDGQIPSVTDQAKPLLGHIAGYASHRTIGIGLRTGLVEALARSPKKQRHRSWPKTWNSTPSTRRYGAAPRSPPGFANEPAMGTVLRRT
ncbi:MAG: hypothetical protein KY393_02895 [Actinobacteria bacterium]|nr:hypothetical protein [Actinomycetota bacterium]